MLNKFKKFKTLFLLIVLTIVFAFAGFNYFMLSRAFNVNELAYTNQFVNKINFHGSQLDDIFKTVAEENEIILEHFKNYYYNTQQKKTLIGYDQFIKIIENMTYERLITSEITDSASFIYMGEDNTWYANWFVTDDESGRIIENGPYDYDFIFSYFGGSKEFNAFKEDPLLTENWFNIAPGDIDPDKYGDEFLIENVTITNLLRDENNKFLFFVTGDVPTASLKDILHFVNFEGQGEPFILNENKEVLYFFGDSFDTVDLVKSTEIVGNEANIIKTRQNSVFTKKLYNNWFLGIEIENATLYKDYYQFVRDSIFLLVLFVLIISGMTFYIGKLISHPLERFAKSVKAFDVKKPESLSRDLPVQRSDEIGLLASEIISMERQIINDYEQLQEYNLQLEHLVNQKTHDLQLANIHLKNMLDHSSRQQAKLGELNNELEVSMKKLKRTQESLIESEKNAALSNLVAGIAHEINTPIGIGITCISHTEMENEEFMKRIEDGKITKKDLISYMADLHDSTELIKSSLERAAELTKSFKQIAVDQVHLSKSTFNVKEYIEILLISLKHELKKQNIHINIECPDDLTINNYSGALSQVLTNLIMNTLQHAYDDHDQIEIDITIETYEEEICLVFKDKGKGIPLDIITRIFEPFFTTSRGRGGSGLGLSIVYNIITQKMMGTIKCESEIGHGTTFKINIPK